MLVSASKSEANRCNEPENHSCCTRMRSVRSRARCTSANDCRVASMAAWTIGQHAPAVRPGARSTRRRWRSSRTRLFPLVPPQPFPPHRMILQTARLACAVAPSAPSFPPSKGRGQHMFMLQERNGPAPQKDRREHRRAIKQTVVRPMVLRGTHTAHCAGPRSRMAIRFSHQMRASKSESCNRGAGIREAAATADGGRRRGWAQHSSCRSPMSTRMRGAGESAPIVRPCSCGGAMRIARADPRSEFLTRW
jgi:hypothetical protein